MRLARLLVRLRRVALRGRLVRLVGLEFIDSPVGEPVEPDFVGLVVVLDLSQCYREGLEALGVLLNIIGLLELLDVPRELGRDRLGVQFFVDPASVLAEARGVLLEHARAVLAEARRRRVARGRRGRRWAVHAGAVLAK